MRDIGVLGATAGQMIVDYQAVSPAACRFMGSYTVNPIKLETGLRPNSAGTPYTLLLRIEAIGFPTFWLLL